MIATHQSIAHSYLMLETFKNWANEHIIMAIADRHEKLTYHILKDDHYKMLLQAGALHDLSKKYPTLALYIMMDSELKHKLAVSHLYEIAYRLEQEANLILRDESLMKKVHLASFLHSTALQHYSIATQVLTNEEYYNAVKDIPYFWISLAQKHIGLIDTIIQKNLLSEEEIQDVRTHKEQASKIMAALASHEEEPKKRKTRGSKLDFR